MIVPRSEVITTPLAVHGGRYGVTDGAASVRYDFSVCLNTYGPADVVRDAIRGASLDEYPDPYCRGPRRTAAARWDRGIEEIAFGAGAAELIHAVCSAYLSAGDTVLIVTPAFGEYERAARLRGATPRYISYVCPDSGLDRASGEEIQNAERLCEQTERERPRLVFLCTPANPTGYGVSRSALHIIADTCAAVGSLLVLDQAYDAFSTHPLGTPALPGHPAVLHLRSLTKEHALAGVRAAFAVGPAQIIHALEQVRVPWVASALAQAAGVAVFEREAEEHVQRSVSHLRAEAISLMEACARLGFAPFPSTTHFFLLHVGDAQSAQATLHAHAGIYVRDCRSFGLPAWIRVAARTPTDNDVLLRALHALSSFDTIAIQQSHVHNSWTSSGVSSQMSDTHTTSRTNPLASPEPPSSTTGRKAPVPKRKKPGAYRVLPRAQRHGLLIVNTGNGKGKTTAALGLLLRATGREMRVGMFQFIKSADTRYGEHIAAERLGVDIIPLGDGFTWLSDNIADDRALAERGWARVREVLADGTYDVLILDELTYCLTFGWLDEGEVIAALCARPIGTHVVVTGRDASSALIAAADLVTEMRVVKHPYRDQGIAAQAGIEL